METLKVTDARRLGEQKKLMTQEIIKERHVSKFNFITK